MLLLRLSPRLAPAPRLARSLAMASAWRPVAAPPHDVYTTPIQRSPNDDREYRIIRLRNGLHAMLVHDARADKAAAGLAVTVGHLSDPVSATGAVPVACG